MFSIINAAFSHARTTISLLAFTLISGVVAYLTLPKESSPDIAIPVLYVSVGHQGISPADAERLIVRPLEEEFRGIEGVKEMTSNAMEGHASIVIKFNVGVDLDRALVDVRNGVIMAKPKLPDGTEEPTIHEVTLSSEESVLSVVLYGNVSERTTIHLARELKSALEKYRQILKVDIAGDREDVVEVVVDPLIMESYGLDQNDIYNLIAMNNRVVPAGYIDTGYGRFSIKVPSVFESLKDIMELPVKVDGAQVITFSDIATIKQTFRDPESFARFDGASTIVLDIKKRAGENIIEAVDIVKSVLHEVQKQNNWPNNLSVRYILDESKEVKFMLSDLQNSIFSAILLVVIVIIAILGIRSAFLVGFSIPASFLIALLVLAAFDLTINVVVLFALVLSVGLLVDGAIVVTEYADQKMQQGSDRREAYREAAKRMTGPIVASTATTLAAFAPLLFWPDVTGEFMKYLPITLIATLTASMAMALIFIPVLGGIFGKPLPISPAKQKRINEINNGQFNNVTGITRTYYLILVKAIHNPIKVLIISIFFAVSIGFTYSKAGLGTVFFPDIEPAFFTIKVRSYGDLSIYEKDSIIREIETILLDSDEYEGVYTKTGGNDEIGQIQVTLKELKNRRPAKVIIEELRQTTQHFPGIEVEYAFPNAGPPVEHDVVIELSLLEGTQDKLQQAAILVRQWAETNPAFTNLSDSIDKPGIDWSINIKRDDASRFGADALLLGNTIQLMTNGMKISDYLPDHQNQEVDILVRYLAEYRDIGGFDTLRVKTPNGLIPITNFANIYPKHKQNSIQRIDGRRVVNIRADINEDYNLSLELPKIKYALNGIELPEGIDFRVRGQNEEQDVSSAFIKKAFMVALACMALILITQFNSFYQAFLILTAVIFSTIGVFAGLLIFQQPFGVVMSGVGIIALAGIVVNNNIVLIVTFNQFIKRGIDKKEAILFTGVQRLRPVLLTTATTILGLLPMALEMNIDFINQSIDFGVGSTQWWSQLAAAVAGGLAFATILTLLLTPCLLMLGHRKV